MNLSHCHCNYDQEGYSPEIQLYCWKKVSLLHLMVKTTVNLSLNDKMIWEEIYTLH